MSARIARHDAIEAYRKANYLKSKYKIKCDDDSDDELDKILSNSSM